MADSFYKGNLRYDYEHYHEKKHQGWVVGKFMTGVRQTDQVEVKFWKYKKGEHSGHPYKMQKTAVECTFILKGQVQAEIEGKKITLQTGDYVVIPPQTVNNLVLEIVEDVEGLTLKAPSDPTDKVVVSKASAH